MLPILRQDPEVVIWWGARVECASAADSLQLAAAIDWCEERTTGAGFVCLDQRLRSAALREGFDVVPWPEEIHEP
ncbi:MAG TPA: hypothetical protein VJA16_09915 [Thermoanaerobaculia bacterium]